MMKELDYQDTVARALVALSVEKSGTGNKKLSGAKNNRLAGKSQNIYAPSFNLRQFVNASLPVRWYLLLVRWKKNINYLVPASTGNGNTRFAYDQVTPFELCHICPRHNVRFMYA